MTKFPRVRLTWMLAALLPSIDVIAAVPDPGFLRVYGEERQVNVAEEWEAFAFQNKGVVGGVKPRTTAFETAMKLAHELAAKAVPKAKLLEARKVYPAGNDSATFLMMGMGKMASGDAGASLACFVAAFDADAKNPEAWFDLASCLAQLGYANEALAILQEMTRRSLKPDPALGLSADDVMEYERGYCLAALGDNPGARKFLEPVAARQPLLSEASKMLALIDAAEGKNPRANFLLGVWRRRGVVTVCGGNPGSGPEPDPMTTGEEVAMDLREILDMAKGRVGQLPRGRYPTVLEEVRAQYLAILKKQQSLRDEMTGLLKQETAELAQLKKTDENGNPTWGAQLYELVQHLESRDRKLREFSAQILPLGRDTRKADDLAHDEIRKGNEALIPSKDKTLATERAIKRRYYEHALQHTLTAYQREEQLEHDTFAEWNRLATAIGGNLADPGWREVFRLRIAAHRAHAHSSALASVAGYCSIANTYLWDPAVVDPPANAEETEMGRCDGKRSIGLSTGSLADAVTHGVPGLDKGLPAEIGVELNCEGISVELGIGGGPFQASVEFGMASKGGYNLFIGPRGTYALEAMPFKGTGVTTKGGISISGNKDGITEVALKAETKAVVSSGPVNLATKIQEASMVMISAPVPVSLENLAPFGTER